MTPDIIRALALGAIALVCVLKLSAALGADWVWWLEAPVHFQAQYAVTLALSLIGLAGACSTLREFTTGDGIAVAAAVLVGGHAAATVLALTPAQRALAPPTSSAGDGDAGGFRLLTANVERTNRRHRAVLDLVLAEAPDVVLLIELNNRWAAALQPLADHYPFYRVRAVDERNFGIGVWSRLPVDHFALEGHGPVVRQVHMVLRLPGDSPDRGRPFRFLGLHPAPPISAGHTAQRNRVYDEIGTLLASEPQMPVIVAGDLNNTRFSGTFQRFCRRSTLFDAGCGFRAGRTWPAGFLGGFLGVRIDHVLTGRDWRIRGFRVGPDIGSNHFPVVADLQLASHTPEDRPVEH